MGLLPGASKTLGLAFHEGRILAAEIRISGGKRSVSRLADFAFLDHLDLNDPEALGKALADFLRAQRFTARHAVIGLPVQWLMTRQQSVPPAEDEALGGLLRIQAERAFSYDGRDLVVDYITQGSGGGGKRTVLLFAALKRKVDQALAIAGAAGLNVHGITSSTTTLALASTTVSNRPAELMVQLIPDAVELAVRRGRRFHTVRHLAVPVPQDSGGEGAPSLPWIESLTSELRRVMAATPDETGWTDGIELALWDGVGLPAEAREDMGRRLSLKAGESCGLSSLAEVNGAISPGPEGCKFAAAVALARAAGESSLLAVDFLHSRLAPPRKSRFDWRARMAAIAGTALVLVMGVFTYDWYSTSSAVTSLKQETGERADLVQEAENLIQKVETANGWYDARPRQLECMLQLSRLFPEDGRVWATELTLPDNLNGILSGKATDGRTVNEVIDRLRKSPLFTGVTLHGGIRYPRENSRDKSLSFSVSFRFRGVR